MPGSMSLYITSCGNVYRVPRDKKGNEKSMPKLAGKSVLFVRLQYDTIERKPNKVVAMLIDRLDLNNNGEYILTVEEAQRKCRNYINYFLITPEVLSEREEPWELPNAPIIPSKVEKESLTAFIKRKYPKLWRNSPGFIEAVIRIRLVQHKELCDLLRKASRIRKKRENRAQ
jgi:hypothetical protein